MRSGLIIARMVINMNETQLRTIGQVEQFLSASKSIEFSAAGDDSERYRHISRVLKRFDYPRLNSPMEWQQSVQHRPLMNRALSSRERRLMAEG